MSSNISFARVFITTVTEKLISQNFCVEITQHPPRSTPSPQKTQTEIVETIITSHKKNKEKVDKKYYSKRHYIINTQGNGNKKSTVSVTRTGGFLTE